MKHKYRALCLEEKSIPLFSRDWWLDAVCGEDKWDVLWLEDKGRVQAALPLYIPHKGIVSMPPFTQTMGPWFAPVADDMKYTSLLS
ncbi:MAG: GNAT family N-acetyltransferase, partial [Tannerellaceae bacterium]|nr:GNAT family N-acetyltransferase [Tannerellaceae bacterium]